MKKIVVMIVCLLGITLYGMEQQNKEFSILIGNTQIKVMECPLYDALQYNNKENVDLVCVGRKEQRMLREPSFGDCNDVGRIFFNKDNVVNTLYYHKSFSNEVTVPFSNDSKLYETMESKEVNVPLMSIVEPTIREEDNYTNGYPPVKNDYFYYALHRTEIMPTRKTYETEAYGQEALDEATIDLALCYEILLKKAFDTTQSKRKCKITMSGLSSQVGLPWDLAAVCAVKSLLNFLEKHSERYSFICLCVNRKSEFELYQALLNKATTSDVDGTKK